MELTLSEKLLIRGCKIIGASEQETIAIMYVLENPTHQKIMLDWMAEHLETATVSDLIGKTMEIMHKEGSHG